VLNLGIMTTDRTGADGYDANGNYTGIFGGTSAATPLVAGVVGLILSRNPNLTQRQVRRILKSTVDRIGPEPYDARGRNDRYGFGRINAFEAVRAAQQ
jgi:subtilisin family serine protease